MVGPNHVRCKIEVEIVPLILLLAKLTILSFWSLHSESASNMPLRFMLSSLVSTILVAFELHLTPLIKHECDIMLHYWNQ